MAPRTDVRMVTCGNLPAPDPDTPRIVAALTARGVRADIADWRDERTDWSGAPVTVLRSPWDYVDDRDGFLAWAAHAATVSALWNPLEVVRWNTHKSYLLDLSARGAPIVPTVVLPQGSAAALDGIADARGWNTVVVKPAVGIGGLGAGRFDVGDAAGQAHLDALLPSGDVLVQQYVSSIEHDGELSIIVFDGRATHAVRKVPAPGEFRVQERYGGRFEACEPAPGSVELAERVVTVLPAAVLYARIDIVQTAHGGHVIEVEATEPSLFLEVAPEAATGRLVDAIIARLPRPGPYDSGRP